MELTIKQVTETIREIVKGNEDFVYDPQEDPTGGSYCVYSTPDGAPSCIVGHVINRLAPEDFKTIHGCEWYEDGGFATNLSASGYNYSEDFETNTSLQHALRQAQIVQDSAGTWG